MDIKYSKICTVQAKHAFFEEYKCPVFSYTLTPESSKFLSAYGFLLKKTSEGFEIWANDLQVDRKSNVEELQAGVHRITVVLNLSDLAFLNYTDVPTENLDTKIYYFTNLNTHAVQVEEDPLNMITRKDQVGADDRVAFYPKVFTYNPVSSLLEEKIEITSPEQELVDPKHILYNQAKNEYQIDLSNYPDGLYQLSMQGKKTNFYICNDFSWHRPFGVIDLYFNNTVPANFRMTGKQSAFSLQEYAFFFNARSTIWKYYVMSDHLKELEGLAVTNGKSGSVFKGPTETAITDKRKALVFESDKPIPFKQKPSTVFQLQKEYDPAANKGKIVVGGLPYPATDIIKRDVNSNSQLYFSEMFIY